MTYFYRTNERNGAICPHKELNLAGYFPGRFFDAIKPRKAKLDMMLRTLRKEPTDKMLPKDPIDPIEKAEPREPIDINEFVDHKLNTEFFEPMLLMEFSLAILSP